MRRWPVLLLLLATALSGCAVVPGIEGGITVAQYANSAYTGYELTDRYYPRSRVASDPGTDRRLEGELRERLGENPATHYAQVKALVYDGEVFVLGLAGSAQEREAVTRVVRETPGVHAVTRCLLDPRDAVCGRAESEALAGRITARLAAIPNLRTANLRVEMVGCHAVVLAYVRNEQDRQRIRAALDEVRGPRSVTAYLALPRAQDRDLAAR